jgi:glycerate kinase
MAQTLMKFLIAIDKFKGTITSKQAGKRLKQSILESFPDAKVLSVPVADGGDGSLEVLEKSIGFDKIYIDVHGPLNGFVRAWYGLKKESAYIEMAKASGIVLLAKHERNPMITSSYGVGEIIKDAIERGAKNIFLFVGGSATNDAGIGMAAALGYSFYDKDKNSLKPIGQNLIHIESIVAPEDDSITKGIKFKVVTDVDNFLTGEMGATIVYGPQKGAGREQIEQLEKGMIKFAILADNQIQSSIISKQGAGAAGGLAAGAMWFLGAELLPGFTFMAEILGIENQIRLSDYILTGEGKFDDQSLQGKVVSGVIKLAEKYQKPVFVFCGLKEISNEKALPIPSKNIYAISDLQVSQKESMEHAEYYLGIVAKNWILNTF